MGVRATDTGIENTNYFVTARDQQGISRQLVLTLFERFALGELPYFLELTTFLAHRGLPVPAPYRDRDDQALHLLAGKPAILVPRFGGHHPAIPNLAQCRAIAHAMAQMHLASPDFPQHRANDRDRPWREQALDQLQPFLQPAEKTLLQEQLADWRQHQSAIDRLPAGINHHDLFHDNALFEGDHLTGIIDFYNACDDVFIYDLAVLVNDWCSDASGALVAERYHAVMAAYQELRPLTTEESTLWPRILRYAALRFWISRLLSWHLHDARETVSQKDPAPMRRMLLQRLE